MSMQGGSKDVVGEQLAKINSLLNRSREQAQRADRLINSIRAISQAGTKNQGNYQAKEQPDQWGGYLDRFRKRNG